MGFSTFNRLIMAKQTLFALPFAYIGVLFAGKTSFMTWIWVTIALVSARTAGMCFNRTIDAEIDAKNQRTQNREIPSGAVSPYAVWLMGIVSSLLLVFSSYMLNNLCFKLSFLAVFLLFTYSYFKRFSASSHFYLGVVEAAAPLGGYFAVTGEVHFTPFLLGSIILFWIAGLDIIYAFQDIKFDKKEKLHSLPVLKGKSTALLWSSLSYVFAVSAIICAGILTGRGVVYWTSAILISIVLLYQQVLARQEPVEPAVRKIFHANMYISPVLFIGTLVDSIHF